MGVMKGYVATRTLFQDLHTIQGERSQESIISSLENLDSFNVGFASPMQ